MSRRALFVPLSAAFAFLTLSVGPLAAQVLKGSAGQRQLLGIEWRGSREAPQTIDIMSFSWGVSQTAVYSAGGGGKEAKEGNTAAIKEIQTTIARDRMKDELLARLQAAFAQGRRADLTITTLAPNGKIEQRCILKNATMTHLDATMGAQPLHRAGFTFEAMECTTPPAR